MSRLETVPNISIILPTFNERNNVQPITAEIAAVFSSTTLTYEIIFVDDSSDNTPEAILSLRPNYPNVRLIHRAPKDRTGLGTAILEGIRAASSDVVCVMDSDLQHPPSTILTMYESLLGNPGAHYNLIIASRMIESGSAEGLANQYRHAVSRASRLLAWILLPLTKKTSDPMTGFFMVLKSVLPYDTLKPIGFKILVELMSRTPTIVSTDVPFVMRKRAHDVSKASLKEGVRYLYHLVKLAITTPRFSILKYVYVPMHVINTNRNLLIFASLFSLVFLSLATFTINPFETILLGLSLLLIVQLLYTLYILIYAWDHPERIADNASPASFAPAKYSFTAVIPALNEAEVIPHTIRAVANINYPEYLKETFIVLRDTDIDTIRAATQMLNELDRPNIKIKLISGEPFNKPHHLNAALESASSDIICIFDAEDEPHSEIYDVVNTVMLRDQADVVQCGVQLMNFESNWYSLFNVLEYFLWFGSALHFYERQGIIPLGGNTVFFKTHMVRALGGWDLEGLTEDAEIGIRLSSYGAKIRVVYDPKHATQEETPPTLQSFIKQRTRWSQGFLQILSKRRALRKELPALSFKRELLTLYILGWPRIHAFMFLYIPIAFLLSFVIKMHLVVTIVTILPMLLLAVYLVVQNIALFEFTKIYQKKWHPKLIWKTIVWFFPYQFILSLSSFRAMVRQFKQQTSWEKTEHINAHRTRAESV